jgi:hypothetical protein
VLDGRVLVEWLQSQEGSPWPMIDKKVFEDNGDTGVSECEPV